MNPPANSSWPPPRITLAALARRLGVSSATVYSWVDKGVWVSGARIKLASTRLGGRRFVSEEDFKAFESACNPAPTPQPGNPAKDARRAKESQAMAMRMLGLE